MKTLITIGLLLFSFTGFSQEKSIDIECKIEGMTCESCARTAEKVLSSVEGVDSVVVNFSTKTARVYASGEIDTAALKEAIAEETNFDILFKGEKKVEPLTEEERKKVDIKTIKGGEKINFEEHFAAGKITVFDFYADWCGPCRVFSPKVERLLLEYPGAALRKVDVVKWESPLAKQLTKDYKLPALPFTLIFNDKGKLIGKVEGNKIEEVREILNKHL